MVAPAGPGPRSRPRSFHPAPGNSVRHARIDQPHDRERAEYEHRWQDGERKRGQRVAAREPHGRHPAGEHRQEVPTAAIDHHERSPPRGPGTGRRLFTTSQQVGAAVSLAGLATAPAARTARAACHSWPRTGRPSSSRPTSSCSPDCWLPSRCASAPTPANWSCTRLLRACRLSRRPSRNAVTAENPGAPLRATTGDSGWCRLSLVLGLPHAAPAISLR
jgi:hypothetical protein